MLLSLALTAATALAPVFPARTPAQVVALATQDRVTGAATYDARQEATSYRFSVAQRGVKVRGRFATAGGGAMWVGYEPGPGVTFVCVRPRGKRITCQRGDPGGAGLRILTSLAAPVANDTLRALLAPLTRNGRGDGHAAPRARPARLVPLRPRRRHAPRGRASRPTASPRASAGRACPRRPSARPRRCARGTSARRPGCRAASDASPRTARPTGVRRARAARRRAGSRGCRPGAAAAAGATWSRSPSARRGAANPARTKRGERGRVRGGDAGLLAPLGHQHGRRRPTGRGSKQPAGTRRSIQTRKNALVTTPRHVAGQTSQRLRAAPHSSTRSACARARRAGRAGGRGWRRSRRTAGWPRRGRARAATERGGRRPRPPSPRRRRRSGGAGPLRMLASSSIAVTRAPPRRSSAVMWPVPAPTSTTSSPVPTQASATSSATTRRVRRCLPGARRAPARTCCAAGSDTDGEGQGAHGRVDPTSRAPGVRPLPP